MTPDRVARARPILVTRGAPSPADGAGPVLEVVRADGRDTALVWHDGGAVPPWAPVPAAAFTRLRVAPWVWPLMPAALVVDAAIGPILLFFAPAIMVVGE